MKKISSTIMLGVLLGASQVSALTTSVVSIGGTISEGGSNTEVSCDASGNCTLRPITMGNDQSGIGTITDRMYFQGSSGSHIAMNSFLFPADDGGTNTYEIKTNGFVWGESGLRFDYVDITGNADIAGNIISDTGPTNYNANGLYMDDVTIGGTLTIDGDITTSTTSGMMGSNGMFVSDSALGDVVINGNITSSSSSTNVFGARLYNSTAGDITIAGDISSTSGSNSYATMFSFGEVGTINVSGNITASSSGGTANAIYLRELTDSGFNYITTINNTGSIISTRGAAIMYFGVTDNIFNYSGSGTISGSTYDIDMGDGNDVVNISGATTAYPSMNSVETVNITNSTMQLDLTDANKSTVLLTTNNTTAMSLVNVTFDLNTTATGFVAGDQFTLMSVDTITGDTGTLTANFGAVGFDTTGYFDIVDNAGTDELVYIFGAAPVAPVASASSSFASSGVVAAQISNVTDQQLTGRMADARLQRERQQFTSLYSDTGYYVYEQPRSQAWVQAFGLSGTYDGESDKGLDGYDTTLGGVVAGYDYNWGLMRTGMALTYANGRVEGEDNGFEVDVEAFTGALYSVIDFDRIYVETAASYGVTTFDQDLSGTLNSYDAESMGALLRVGMKMRSGRLGLEPFAGFQYKNVIIEEHYNGVDTVAEYNQEMIKGELGLTTSYQFILDNGDAVVPYIRLETGHDFADNATLTSLDNSGVATGNPESVDLGNWVSRAAAGISFLTRSDYSISGEYEYEFRDHYEAHVGKIKGRLMF